jgi:carbonic anhydrase/acetyltransferase-like protein (isoleucine patch superfamily)
MGVVLPLNGKTPQVAEDAFIAPTAVLVGDVRIGSGASVWFGAVLRGDDPDHPIVVGPEANVQDGAIIHVGHWGPTVIGARVTVGHGAVMECCEIGEGSLIGMRAVVLQNATIGRECLVAAGSVLLEGAEIPDRSLVAGVPGTVRRRFEASTPDWLTRSWVHYSELARAYLRQDIASVEID